MTIPCILKQSRKIKITTFADISELNFGYSLVLVLTFSLFKNKPCGAVRSVEFESKTLLSLSFYPSETK